MFLIVGLGNPGLAYAYTRHNVGFMFVDHMAYMLGFPEFRQRFDSFYSEKVVEGTKVFLQKPQTFMNLSGRAVQQLVSFYKIQPEDVFVVHDDIDLPPLTVKIKFSGSNGGHNGLRDIDKAIGKDYWRIRIGVGRPQLKEQVADYVLTTFYKDELTDIIPDVFIPIANSMYELLFSENRQQTASKILKEAIKK